MLLALMLEDVVRDAGHVARKASRLSNALQMADAEDFDAAILDINLAGEEVFPLAAILHDRGTPFLFVSGYGDAGVPPEYAGYPRLQKPYGLEEFKASLDSLLRSARSRSE